MPVGPMPEMKPRIDEDSDGLGFCIPARREVFGFLFLAVWLVITFFGLMFAIPLIAGGEKPRLFLIVWSILWTLGGARAAFTEIWMIAGQERVLLKTRTLLHRYEVFGIGRGREYELARVRNLRVSPVSLPAWWERARSEFWEPGGGVVAFDYGAKTIRFGAALDEAEANMVVSRMKERHSFETGERK